MKSWFKTWFQEEHQNHRPQDKSKTKSTCKRSWGASRPRPKTRGQLLDKVEDIGHNDANTEWSSDERFWMTKFDIRTFSNCNKLHYLLNFLNFLELEFHNWIWKIGLLSLGWGAVCGFGGGGICWTVLDSDSAANWSTNWPSPPGAGCEAAGACAVGLPAAAAARTSFADNVTDKQHHFSS